MLFLFLLVRSHALPVVLALASRATLSRSAATLLTYLFIYRRLPLSTCTTTPQLSTSIVRFEREHTAPYVYDGVRYLDVIEVEGGAHAPYAETAGEGGDAGVEIGAANLSPPAAAVASPETRTRRTLEKFDLDFAIAEVRRSTTMSYHECSDLQHVPIATLCPALACASHPRAFARSPLPRDSRLHTPCRLSAQLLG